MLIFQSQAQITVKTINPDTNPLVDSLVKTLAGFGVSIDNVSSNLKPSTKSIGTFKATVGEFPLTKGLVMSTGSVDSIPKSNKNKKLSTRMDYADTIAGTSIGKQLLQAILNKQIHTGNPQKSTEISTIKFDLLPVGDSLSFKYIFASEEYPEFVCSNFNDIFGFFIKGPDIEGDSIYVGTNLEGFKNLARIPGNNFPVSINSVNSGISGANGSSQNCNFSPEGTLQFEANNLPGHALYSKVQFDGMTKVMTAKTKVSACNVYTLVLAISDVGDRLFDSGVFLEKGSMVSGTYSTFVSSASNGLSDTIAACHAGKLMFKRCPNINEKWIIRYKKEGNAIADVDYKRRLPNGLLVNVPDSMVLEPGQIADSLMLEGFGSQFQNKNLVFKYLDIQTPYINGQPNFAGNETTIQVRSTANKAVSEISACWFDSAKVVFRGRSLPHIKYRWLGLLDTAEDSDSSLPMNCLDCKTPKIAVDTISKSYRVQIENEQNSCFRFDTVLVSGKPFVLPQFLVKNDTIQLTNTKPGYQYSWIVNGILALSGGEQITFETGDEISLNVSSPNGCFGTIDAQIFINSTRIKEDKSILVNLYPNPATNFIQIQTKAVEKFTYKIISSNGQILQEGNNFKTNTIGISNLSSGLYTIVLQNDKRKFISTRFSKN